MALSTRQASTRTSTRIGTAGPLDRVDPTLLVIAGAVCTSSSSVLVKLSGATAGTAAFFRCALALLVLVPPAAREYRRVGHRPRGVLGVTVAAGALLGVDYVFWAASIPAVGASIATVLINIQVVIFPLLARVFSGIRVSGRFLLLAPMMLAGVGLAAGVVGHTAADAPVRGAIFGVVAGTAYAAYLFLMRHGGSGEHTVFPVATATAAAALSSGVLGASWTGIDLSPGWGAFGHLVALALLGQVAAWLLMVRALPKLAPGTGAALLLLQPVLAVALAMGILGERPTWTQLAGCALVIASVRYATRTRRVNTDER